MNLYRSDMLNSIDRGSLERNIRWFALNPSVNDEMEELVARNSRIKRTDHPITINQEDGIHLYNDGNEVLELVPLPIILLAKGNNYPDEYIIYGRDMSANSPLAILSVGIDFQPDKDQIQKSLYDYLTNAQLQNSPEIPKYQKFGGDYQQDSPMLEQDFYGYDPKKEIIFRTPEAIIANLLKQADQNRHQPLCIISPSTLTLHIDTMGLRDLGMPIYTYKFIDPNNPQSTILNEITGYWET